MGKKKQKNISHGVPEEFLERLADIVGQSLFSQVEKTFVERPTTFRINTLKLETGNWKLLKEQGLKLRQVPWYKDAFILLNKSKRELTELDVYTEGKIYIQSLASMVPALVLNPQPGEKVLDLTAAPGSKTSQIAALMERQGELVANDNNKVRFFKLKHNMEALGVDSPLPRGEFKGGEWSFTLRMEHGSGLCREYPGYFDKILLDAPCSAEARFIDGQPKTYGYWSPRKVREMAYTQRKLLLSAWSALKPGGILVYSTCTFAPEENELEINRLLERYPDEAQVAPVTLPSLKTLKPLTAWHGVTLHPDIHKTVRILPTSEIEGFFVAKVHKAVV